MLLQGRHALVTGGGRGIGRATAAALSAAGATVTVVGRSEAPLTSQALLNRLPRRIIGVLRAAW